MFTSLLPIFLVAVVSAREAREGEVPYQASIRSDIGHMCSGTILDKEWILTSARCIIGLRRRKVQYVVVGTNDVTAPGTSFPVDSIHIHQSYGHYKYDIAMVKVNGTIKFNDKIQPVHMPERNTKPGVSMLYSGWKGASDDRGGPIMEGSKLAAIASIPRRNNAPSVHIRVYELLTWITVTRDPDTLD